MTNSLSNKPSAARINKPVALAVSLAISLATISSIYSNAVSAQQPDSVKNNPDSIKDLWSFADLYQNEQGDYLKLSGRLQLDSAWVESDQGNFNDSLWRRFRFGFSGKQDTFTYALEADINLNNELGDTYNRLTDANVSWLINNSTKLKLLKQSTGFTMDGKTSSKKLLTPQRNNLTNNLWFTAEYFTGVSIHSNLATNWTYNAGVFSSDGDDEIGFSEASYFALFSTSKILPKSQLWEKAELSLDYVFNDTHEDGNTRNFSQVISASSKFQQYNWGLHSDISWGKGDLGQSDLFGVVIMPTYQQSENIQWVARYTYLNSAQENGVRLGRYENKVVSDRGDQYQEIFGGINCFINDHKLKLQTGVQYGQMDDKADDGGEYDGWGLTLALRSYW